MTYRIETTDPVTGTSLKHLMDMPYVVESTGNDDLVIYFESERTRDIYLQDPASHELPHYTSQLGA
jgi:hypothetical protein